MPRYPKGGITKLSELEIDAHKDWAAKKISNLANPVDPDDAAKKDTVDTHAALTTAHSAVSTATNNRIVLRDANARAKFGAPGAAGDALIKGTAITTTEHGTTVLCGGDFSAKTLIIECRTSDPASPPNGRIWLRTDL